MARLTGSRLVAPAKITNYLLDETHPHGGDKARFFQRFGFAGDAPDVLTRALADHPGWNDIRSIAVSRAGIKTVIECRIETPDGRNPCIRTIWALDPGATIHRFVTAYPMKP